MTVLPKIKIFGENGEPLVSLQMNGMSYLMNPKMGLRICCMMTNKTIHNMTDEEFNQALLILEKNLNNDNLLNTIKNCEWKVYYQTDTPTENRLHQPRRSHQNPIVVHQENTPPKVKPYYPYLKETRDQELKSVCNQRATWMKEWSLFSEFYKQFLIEKRHLDPDIQTKYDRKFGIVKNMG